MNIVKNLTISVQNGHLIALHLPSQQSKELKTEWKPIALIMNLFALLFPCCLGAVQFEVDQQSYYVSRSTLQQALGWDSKDPCSNIEQLKQVALTHFNKQKEAPKRLAEQFLALKKTAPHASGYHVHLTSTDSSYKFHIEPTGALGKDIVIPDATPSCACCNNPFLHTFKNEPNDFCKQLSEKIKSYGMFPVFSKSKNLLLVPEASHYKNWAHLFQLNQEQLEKVFAATLQALHFIQERAPSYQPNVEWHIGEAGDQTVGILHTRIQKLPESLSL